MLRRSGRARRGSEPSVDRIFSAISASSTTCAATATACDGRNNSAATTTAAPQQQVIAPLDSLDDSVSGSKVTAAQRASIMTKLAEKAGMDVPAETLKARHVHVVVAVLLLCWRLHLDCISA